MADLNGMMLKEAYDSLMTDPKAEESYRSMKNLGLNEDDVAKGRQIEAALNNDPTNQDAIRQKNAIYAKVANHVAPAERQPGTLWGKIEPGGGYEYDPKKGLLGNSLGFVEGAYHRLKMNISIPYDLDLQAKYFQRRGYEAKTENGRVLVRKDDQMQFKPVDPGTFSMFDVLDLADDAVITAAQAVGTAGKVAAVAGAPVGGLALIPGAVAGAGLLGAAGEYGRQTFAKAIGTRDEYDVPQVIKEGLVSAAIPAVLLPAGAAARVAGAGVSKLAGAFETLKPEVEQIVSSAKRLGVDLFPGMVSASRSVQKLTEAQIEGMGILLNNVKSKVQKIYNKIEESAVDLLSERSGKSAFEAGSAASEMFSNTIKEAADEGSRLYKNANINAFKNGKIDDVSFKADLDALKNEFEGAPAALDAISKFEKVEVKTLKGLQNIRSEIMDEIRVKGGKVTGQEIRALEMLEDAAKKAYDENFDKFVAKASSGEWKTTPEALDAALQSKKAADVIWAKMYDDMNLVLRKPGAAKLKGGPQAIMDKFFDKNPEERWIKNIISEGNYKRVQEIEKRFPELFNELRTAKQQEIYEKWFPGEKFNSQVAIGDLKKMSKEMRTVLFGKDADRKIDDLVVIYQALPKGSLNPSKTASAIDWIDGRLVASNVASFTRGILLGLTKSGAVTQQQLLENLGKTLQGKKIITAAFGSEKVVRPLLPGEVQPNQTTLYPTN